MKRTKIITHFGKAHRDEFLACCVIFFHEYRNGKLCYVERRVASHTDLNNPAVWVVDTGNEYAPTRLNFDHHHLQNDMCSLDLVLQHVLGDHAYGNYRAVSPWLKNTTSQDTGGAKVAAEKLGLELNAYIATRSPIEKFILDRFAETMVIHCESHLALLMRDIGRIIITGAEYLNEDLPGLIGDTPMPVDHHGVRLWDIRSLMTDDTTSLAVINQAAFARGVDLMISSNGRGGSGVGLYRQSWVKDKIDLNLVKDHPHVKFAHKNGYYAVTTADITDDIIMEIVTAAVVTKPDTED